MTTIVKTMALVLLAPLAVAGESATTPTDIDKLELLDYGNYQFYKPYIETVETLDKIAPPPTIDSPEGENDQLTAAIDFSITDPARMAQATQDSRISPDYFAKIYGEAMGIEITKTDTPAIYAVLGRSISSFGLATSDAKKHYNKARPFAVNGLPTCTPYAEDYLSKDGAYPSGHTATGYGVSLVAAAIAPELASTVIERGADYGYSRVVCNAHWLSDVEAGKQVASIVLEELKKDAQFAADLAAAQKEFEVIYYK